MYLVVSKVDRIVGHGVMLITSCEIPVSAILDCLLELQQPFVSLRCAQRYPDKHLNLSMDNISAVLYPSVLRLFQKLVKFLLSIKALESLWDPSWSSTEYSGDFCSVLSVHKMELHGGSYFSRQDEKLKLTQHRKNQEEHNINNITLLQFCEFSFNYRINFPFFFLQRSLPMLCVVFSNLYGCHLLQPFPSSSGGIWWPSAFMIVFERELTHCSMFFPLNDFFL